MNSLLFDDLPVHLASENKCGDCQHIEKWARDGSFFFYCQAIKSQRTSNKLLKVKRKRQACPLFSAKQNSKIEEAGK